MQSGQKIFKVDLEKDRGGRLGIWEGLQGDMSVGSPKLRGVE